MRVMCIQEKPIFAVPAYPWKIKTGDIYEVLQVVTTNVGDYYELDIDPGFGYAVEHFATLPEPDADEIAQEKHEAVIYQR
jgi:hypothetical protein